MRTFPKSGEKKKTKLVPFMQYVKNGFELDGYLLEVLTTYHLTKIIILYM